MGVYIYMIKGLNFKAQEVHTGKQIEINHAQYFDRPWSSMTGKYADVYETPLFKRSHAKAEKRKSLTELVTFTDMKKYSEGLHTLYRRDGNVCWTDGSGDWNGEGYVALGRTLGRKIYIMPAHIRGFDHSIREWVDVRVKDFQLNPDGSLYYVNGQVWETDTEEYFFDIHLIPEDIKFDSYAPPKKRKKINDWNVRRLKEEHGMETGVGSIYYNYRQKGFSDMRASAKYFIESGIAKENDVYYNW